ncbi:hypothetical protein HY643_01280 [Candidatus Woesearchaeota archaeon]|nr:hypothetical protein [Candidatus Woesearchaeota archaeon]
MGDNYEKYATAADGVKAVAFTTAIAYDYGFWQFIWGMSAMKGFFAAYFNSAKPSTLYSKILSVGKFSFATFSLAASAGSAITGDANNAKVFGALSVAFYSDLAGEFFRKKSSTKTSGLKQILGKKDSQKDLEGILTDDQS